MVAQIDGSYFRTSPSRSLARLFAYTFIEGRPLTTRGRWINPLVFAQFSLVKALPQLKQVHQPVYILGTGRSGSTFLGNVLSLHPEVCYLNEPKALWHSVYEYEDVLGNYTEDLPASFRLEADAATDDVIRSAHSLYAYALMCTRSSRILDKHGELIFRAGFIQKIFPDARFIFLVRNGSDTVASVARWSESKGSVSASGSNDWWGVNNRKWKLMLDQLVAGDKDLSVHLREINELDNQIDMAAVEWILTMKEGRRLLNDFPDQTMMVRYEDILDDPGNILTDIFDFTALKFNKRAMQYALDVLRKPQKQDEITLSPVINEVFNKTLRDMGY